MLYYNTAFIVSGSWKSWESRNMKIMTPNLVLESRKHSSRRTPTKGLRNASESPRAYPLGIFFISEKALGGSLWYLKVHFKL